jgi:hypothetical protein
MDTLIRGYAIRACIETPHCEDAASPSIGRPVKFDTTHCHSSCLDEARSAQGELVGPDILKLHMDLRKVNAQKCAV